MISALRVFLARRRLGEPYLLVKLDNGASFETMGVAAGKKHPYQSKPWQRVTLTEHMELELNSCTITTKNGLLPPKGCV